MQIILNFNFTRKSDVRKAPDFFCWTDEYICRLRAEGSYSSYRSTRALKRKLSLFLKGGRIDIKSVDGKFLSSFCEYLRFEIGNSHNTIVESLKLLHKLIDTYCRQYDISNAAFGDFHLSREQSGRLYLSETEIKAIMALSIPLKSKLHVSRDIFFIECNTGLRISDILLLRWSAFDGDSLNLNMRKTGKFIHIPLTTRAKKLISSYRTLLSAPEDFIFPVLRQDSINGSRFDDSKAIASATTLVNNHLKRLAALAGIDKNISSHTGRHTFATMLINKGASIYDIKELLGHGDVKVTQVYTHLSDERKKSAIALIDD